jgi:hypothetical protein
MLNGLHKLTLLAQDSRLDHLTSQFRSNRSRLDGDDLLLGLLILAIVVLLVWSAAVATQWADRTRRRPSPARLFLRLCRAHRLGWRDGLLLWRLAKSQRLTDPARLFLEPERFEKTQVPAPLQAQAGRLIELRRALFAVEEPAEPPKGDKPGAPRQTDPASVLPPTFEAPNMPEIPSVTA